MSARPHPASRRAPALRRAFLAALLAAAAIALAAPASHGQTYPTPMRMLPPDFWQAKEFAFIKEGDVFHLFWMRHNPNTPLDSTERDFGHAVSMDLRNWTQLDPVLPVRSGSWDDLHVWTPSIVKQGDTFYMFYTGVTSVPFAWNMYQRIGVATSTDLLNWTRYDAPVWSGVQTPWAFADSSVFEGCQFRDAFVMPDTSVAGGLLMYYVTTPSNARDQLIVGAARGSDAFTWSDAGPLWSTDLAHYWGWCESPHVLEHDGLDYLFATTTSGHPLAFRVAPSPLADSTQWSGTYRIYDMANHLPVSDTWFGSEVLSVPFHDYYALVNSTGYSIDIYEIVWGPPPTFTFRTPSIASAVGPDAAGAELALSAVGRARPGQGLLLRAVVPGPCAARVDLFDAAGRRVRTVHDGPLAAGPTLVGWDGRIGGAPAACGIYFAALTTPAGRRVARVPVVW